MNDYVSLLEQSFALANEKKGSDLLADQFFEQFFSTYPETLKYFEGTDIDYFKTKKLNIIFNFIRDIVKSPNYAVGHISQEVMRHQMYGLKDREYYFTLIESLANIVKQAVGNEWHDEYETAWNDTVTAFKSIVAEAVEAYVDD